MKSTYLIPLLLVSAATAQESPSGQTRSTVNGVYTREQADRGQETYADFCLRCHPVKQFQGKYLEIWAGNTVGALYESIANTMPEERPGSLKPGEYRDILAYIFGMNRLPEGKEELTGDVESLRKILIERRKK